MVFFVAAPKYPIHKSNMSKLWHVAALGNLTGHIPKLMCLVWPAPKSSIHRLKGQHRAYMKSAWESKFLKEWGHFGWFIVTGLTFIYSSEKC